MPTSNWTHSLPSAFRQLFLCVLAHVVSLTLFLVAWLAEVSIAPAEPLCYAAAKLALKFYEVLAVFGTILDGDVAAVGADQLLWFE